MQRLPVLLVAALLAGHAPRIAAQADSTRPDSTQEDVIHLKNGQLMRGRIVDSIPGERVIVLRTRSGRDIRVSRNHIDYIVRAARPAPPPAPAPAPAGPQHVIVVDQHGNVLSSTIAPQPAPSPPPALQPKRKEPALAWVLSFVIPGTGQYYNDQIVKGVGFMAMQVLTAGLYLSNRECGAYNGSCSTRDLALVFNVTNWIANMIDAPVSASAINRRNRVALDVGPRPHQLGFSLARVSF